MLPGPPPGIQAPACPSGSQGSSPCTEGPALSTSLPGKQTRCLPRAPGLPAAHTGNLGPEGRAACPCATLKQAAGRQEGPGCGPAQLRVLVSRPWPVPSPGHRKPCLSLPSLITGPQGAIQRPVSTAPGMLRPAWPSLPSLPGTGGHSRPPGSRARTPAPPELGGKAPALSRAWARRKSLMGKRGERMCACVWEAVLI